MENSSRIIFFVLGVGLFTVGVMAVPYNPMSDNSIKIGFDNTFYDIAGKFNLNQGMLDQQWKIRWGMHGVIQDLKIQQSLLNNPQNIWKNQQKINDIQQGINDMYRNNQQNLWDIRIDSQQRQQRINDMYRNNQQNLWDIRIDSQQGQQRINDMNWRNQQIIRDTQNRPMTINNYGNTYGRIGGIGGVGSIGGIGRI